MIFWKKKRKKKLRLIVEVEGGEERWFVMEDKKEAEIATQKIKTNKKKFTKFSNGIIKTDKIISVFYYEI